jgi:manganese transport protein
VTGIAITALSTVVVLSFKSRGLRQVEAIVLGLVLTIAVCFFFEIVMIQPEWSAVFSGLVPRLSALSSRDPLFLAIGILGATVMPHNLYLHSSIVRNRKPGRAARSEKRLHNEIVFAQTDTIVSLTLAFFINAAILVLASAAFHSTGHLGVTEIDQAYHLLDPIVGTGAASLLFGIALLASGQSSTFTGTIAGQILLEGFLKLKIPEWKRRLITRALALLPALFGVWWLGETSVGRLLVISQVVLSFQLPFAIFPLISFVSDRSLMGAFRLRGGWRLVSWCLFAVITAANLWLLTELVR